MTESTDWSKYDEDIELLLQCEPSDRMDLICSDPKVYFNIIENHPKSTELDLQNKICIRPFRENGNLVIKFKMSPEDSRLEDVGYFDTNTDEEVYKAFIERVDTLKKHAERPEWADYCDNPDELNDNAADDDELRSKQSLTPRPITPLSPIPPLTPRPITPLSPIPPLTPPISGRQEGKSTISPFISLSSTGNIDINNTTVNINVYIR